MFQGIIIIIINWHHHVSDSEKSGKRKKEKNRRFHGSIGLVVPADIVETNGTGRAKRRKMQQKKKQEQDDKGKVKGTTCCLWLKQLQTKSQALEDKKTKQQKQILSGETD